MKWSDATKILHAPIPAFVPPPVGKIPLTAFTKTALDCLDSNFRKTSEMEAVLSVALLVIQAIDGLSGVNVELQP